MPEFITDNLGFIVIGGFVIGFIFMITILRYNLYMSKFFSNKKFRINSAYNLEPTEDKRSFALTIFNNNVNDTRVIAFGFIYKNHSLNYHKAYLKENKLNENYKVVIQSRDCLEITIDANELKILISDINRGSRRVGRLKAYVADSSGLTIKSKAKAVKKQLKQLFKFEYLADKEKKALIRAQIKEELKAKKDKRKFEKRQKRQERLEKFKLKLKSIFTFKRRKKAK